MTLREQMIADLRRTLTTVETFCSADDLRHLRHAVDRFADTPLADTSPVADAQMVKRQDLRHGLSTLRDLIRAGERQQAALAGQLSVTPTRVWNVDACAVWATVSWHTTDHARMRRLLDAWDRHLSHPSLPQTLAPRLREAGFSDVTLAGHTFATTALDPETYGGAFTPLIVQYAVEQGGMDADDPAWKAEQDQLAARNEFYFACIQLCFGARKPGA